MLPFIFGAISTAAGLYSIMSTTESACSALDSYVDKNIDIMTKSPVLGYVMSPDIALRSKSERRRIDRYNTLLAKLVGEHLDCDLSDWQNRKWAPEQVRAVYRFGAAAHEWWKSGFTGQRLGGENTIDPRVQPIFAALTTEEKAIIASAQSLICDLER